ncbi:MAG TPA: AAA family ATPase [Streptosporangiaceae bacterium]|nr:AAA family ATPase [Terriglobales bacterium]HUZ35705.1 AAA family ATPase [Streptosporangiaceae bacterium]
MQQFLQSLELKNFTAFAEARLDFAKGLNVLVGENATGKTHLLKLPYAVMAVSSSARKAANSPEAKVALNRAIASKLVGVFRPERLGRLARRRMGRVRAEVGLTFTAGALNVAFSFSTDSASEVTLKTTPTEFLEATPAFIPTRELLTLGPQFVSVYDQHYLDFEETWRDTCALLGVPLQRGPKEARVAKLLRPLGEAMGGTIVVDRPTGRFYFKEARAASGTESAIEAIAPAESPAAAALEIPLLAEGLRKLGMIAYLIANGTLLENGFLFWDEPEANLNPKLIRAVARAVVSLCDAGIQVFIATHSLFLLRELEMLEPPRNGRRYFGLELGATAAGTRVHQGDSISEIGDILSLKEEIRQADEYLTEIKPR